MPRKIPSPLAWLLLFCLSLPIFSQTDSLARKQLNTIRAIEAPIIDGKIDESVWFSSAIATDFVQASPSPMGAPSQRTEVKVLYDNNAIYVAAKMFDTAPDSILQALSERDELRNSDFFGVYFDPFQDNLNGVSFVVTPTNIQVDEKFSANGSDTNWDAVWKSAATINEDGWTVEMQIPLAALRFPKTEIQKWNINFQRNIRRLRETSWWSPIDPKVNGFFNQFGELNGVQNIEPPTRLFLYPYVSSTVDIYSDPSENLTETDRRFNGGLDLKYGINEAFTLDMTLVPDFGNVRSDNQVLNLSPFEVRFDENRQFFTEGTELFNKGGIFYSRRVGGTPLRYFDVEDDLSETEEIVSNPSQGQLLNATKISGRTKGKLGIGLFNAVVAKEEALIRDSESLEERTFETSPLTNYNVFVLDQGLNNNSSISLINTNVHRFGQDYDANVVGTILELQNKKGTVGLGTQVKYNKKYGGYEGEDDDGYTYGIALKKISGNLTGEIYHYAESHDYDPNDLGFLFANNEKGWGSYMAYNIFEPFWILNRFQANLNIEYTRRDLPNKFANFYINTGIWGFTKNFHAGGIVLNLEPIITYDFFESRRDGWAFRYPVNYLIHGWLSTDYRKTFAFDARSTYRWFEDDRHVFELQLEPRWRINDHMLLIYSWRLDDYPRDIGYATTLDNEEEDIIFGRRNVRTIENLLDLSYIFNANMSLGFRLRHYWATADFFAYNRLDENGYLQFTDYTGIEEDGSSSHDSNFNAFNIDLNYRWQFAPGSELLFTWKNAILSSGDEVDLSYKKNFEQLLDQAQNNSLTIKLLYFFDYNQLKHLRKS